MLSPIRNVPRLLLISIAFATSPLWAGSHTATDSKGETGKRAEGAPAVAQKAVACPVKDEEARKHISEETGKAALKAYLGTLAVSNRYVEVKEAFTNQPYNRDMSTDALRSFIRSYTERSSENPHSKESSLELKIAPFFMGAYSLTSYGGLLFDEGRAFRGRAWSSVITGGLSLAGLSSGEIVGKQALSAMAKQMTPRERDRLRHSLEMNTSESAKFLGDTLGWDAHNREVFSKALNREVVKTFTIETTSPAGLYGSLARINFIDLIEKEELAPKETVEALRQLQRVHQVTRYLESPNTGTAVLAKENNSLDGLSLAAQIDQLRMLHGMLEAARAAVPPGSARNALSQVIEDTAWALVTLQHLCELSR